MATDARGHTVPAGDDEPKRSDLTGLSLSVNDAIPVANATERATKLAELAGLADPIVPAAGAPLFFFRADAGEGLELEYTIDGTTFNTVPASPSTPKRMAAGKTTITPSGTDTQTSRAIAFPSGRFTSAPVVVVTPETTVPHSSNVRASVSNVTAAGCTIWLGRDTATATDVHWIAVQL